MRRYRIAIVAVLLHAILSMSMPVLAQSTFYTVYVNGVKVSGYPLIRDGVAYLPTNTLAEAMGLSIKWDARLNIIKINDTVVAARPLNEEGRLFLPVEAVAHAVGGAVEWDGKNRAIRVSSTGGSVAVAPSTSPLTVPVGPTVPVKPPATVPVTTVPSTAPTVIIVPPGVPTTPSTTTTTPPPTSPNPNSLPPIRPPSAPPRMPPNLQLPPPEGVPGQPDNTNTNPPAHATRTVYVPKSAQNNVFHVTVTNVETTSSIKDFYHPRPGYKFVVVYLSQQNVSNEVQIYTGRFSLLDQQNRNYDYIEGLSNFWLVILRPYGINFGYLVFEMPNDAQATRIALHALNQSPLTLNL